MSNHSDQVEEAKTTDILNIYLDFEKKPEKLLRHLRHLKRLHRDRLLPDCSETEDLLERFVEIAFPEGLSQTYYFSNTSLKEGLFDITIRPCIDGPRLERAFPAGLVLCVRGHLSPPTGPASVLVIDRIVDIFDSTAKPFELTRTVITYSHEENVYRKRRRNCLLHPEFIDQLPLISQQTHEKLKDWRGYLAWKQKIVENRLAGVRYLNVELTEDGLIRFLTVCENSEVFDSFKRHLRKDELMAFDTGYSRNSWTFEYNEDYSGSPCKLDDFERFEVLKSVPDGFAELPWDNPFTAHVFFQLSEEERDYYDESTLPVARHEKLESDNLAASNGDLQIPNHQVIAKAHQAILSRFPAEGFLALSAFGDKALIERQNRVLADLEQQSGYGPFLSSYLFDVTKANLPVELSEVESWLDDSLNPDQKKAVCKMLAAPDLALVQGPPGTGKTTVIAEAVYQFARKGKKVLVASQANLAVDNVLEKLASTPVIRAIRLGKKERIDERLRLTKENVLGIFYKNLADTCRKNHLEPWQTVEKRISDTRKWLQDCDVIYKDINSFREKLDSQLQQRLNTQRDRDNEEKRLNELYQKNQQIRQQRENLSRFQQFLQHREDIEFILPEQLLDTFYDKVVTAVDKLAKVHIEVNQWWHVKKAESPGRRCLFVRQILSRWRQVLEYLPQVKNDLARLKRLQIEQIVDPETAGELENLRIQIEQATNAMVDDESQLEVFRQLKKRERMLKERSCGLDCTIYSKIFTGSEDNQPCWNTLCQPNVSRQQAESILAAAIKQIEKAAPQVEKGLHRIESTVEKMLKSLQPEPLEEKNLHSLDGQLRHLNVQIKETRERLNLLDQRLKEKIKETTENAWLGGQDLPDDYPRVREEITRMIKHNQSGLQEVQDFRDTWEPILTGWVADLENPESFGSDQHHFLDTFIENCNVVGITCNEKRRTLTDKGHTYFDVVIIDEVSKATPPELLMPMILGRTTILVGDHRQLPPLFTERKGSWQEVVEQQRELSEEQTDEELDLAELTQENFERYRKMVTSSLFKEHFEKADNLLKTPLFYQYRMHPDIMDVINCFYENNLKCGLKKPDEDRKHSMTIKTLDGSELINPSRHAIWIDSSHDPTGRKHFEQQAGTSKINDLEAVLIAQMLAKVNRECRRLGYNTENRKPVGVISFYGRQVSHLRRVIKRYQRLFGRFEAIWYDVNTVDRFQGKEKPVILVSLVRNKDLRRKSKSAYVAQFERINVAFSRAQELLVVFGAKDMFYDYPVGMPYLDRSGYTTKRVYQKIINDLNRKGCFWESSRVLSPQEYERTLTNLLPEKARRLRIQESRRHRPRSFSHRVRR